MGWLCLIFIKEMCGCLLWVTLGAARERESKQAGEPGIQNKGAFHARALEDGGIPRVNLIGVDCGLSGAEAGPWNCPLEEGQSPLLINEMTGSLCGGLH